MADEVAEAAISPIADGRVVESVSDASMNAFACAFPGRQTKSRINNKEIKIFRVEKDI